MMEFREYKPALAMHKRTYDFACRVCGGPGTSDSPNCKVHQTKACKEQHAKAIIERSVKRRREKRQRARLHNDMAKLVTQ